jgi:integration host factor subunit beta
MSVRRISRRGAPKHEGPKDVSVPPNEIDAVPCPPMTKLDAMTAEFDALLGRMQTPKARASMKAAFNTSPRQLAKTASTVTKADLVDEVVRVTEFGRKESEAVVETIFESIIGALQDGDRIEIRGFGTFRTRQRRGRIGRNRKTGKKLEAVRERIPFFKPSQEFKDFVNIGGRVSTSEAKQV